jgi:hypothetical protein
MDTLVFHRSEWISLLHLIFSIPPIITEQKVGNRPVMNINISKMLCTHSMSSKQCLITIMLFFSQCLSF